MAYSIGTLTIQDWQMKSFLFSRFTYDQVVNESIDKKEILIKNIKVFYSIRFQGLTLAQKNLLIYYIKFYYQEAGYIVLSTDHPNIENNYIYQTITIPSTINFYHSPDDVQITENEDRRFDVSFQGYVLEVV